MRAQRSTSTSRGVELLLHSAGSVCGRDHARIWLGKSFEDRVCASQEQRHVMSPLRRQAKASSSSQRHVCICGLSSTAGGLKRHLLAAKGDRSDASCRYSPEWLCKRAVRWASAWWYHTDMAGLTVLVPCNHAFDLL